MARVLYFTRDYTPHDHRFLARLAGSAHHTVYLRLERRSSQVEDRPIPSGIETYSWGGGKNPIELKDYPRVLIDLWKVIREVKPDLIHAGPIQSCAFLTALAGFKPLVSMSWGYDLLLEADRNSFSSWAARFTLNHSSVLVGDCRAVREKARKLGMAADRIVIFPWGVDLEKFAPDVPDRNPGEVFTLLSTRNWEPIYGVDVLARAFVKAALKRPELRLLLLGSGSQEGSLRNIFSEAGIIGKVDFRGAVGQADLPRFYHMADLYVSASHIDGSSVSLMEAMASGIPAIVSDIPGNREWVEPWVHGWRFPDGDVEALEQSILQAVDRRRNLVEMGRAARKRAEEKADWEVNFQKLLLAYDLALGSANP